MIQTDKSATLSTLQDQTVFQPVVYGIGSYHSNAWKSGNPDSGVYEAETSKTLDALNCGYPACNQGGMAIVQTAAGFSYKAGAKAEGIGYEENRAPTLSAERGDAAIVIQNHPADSRVDIDESGVVQTLTSRMGTGGVTCPW